MLRFWSVFLQAVGVLFLIWGVFSWVMLRGERGGLCVRFCGPGSVSRAQRFGETCLWFREAGFVNMRVLLVDGGLSREEAQTLRRFADAREHICFCGPEEVLEILESEAKEHGRA